MPFLLQSTKVNQAMSSVIPAATTVETEVELQPSTGPKCCVVCCEIVNGVERSRVITEKDQSENENKSKVMRPVSF